MAKPNAGFTLIELMVTIAIVAILAAVALPSFSTMIKDNRLATNINDLMADLVLARSEASKRGVRVTVCASSNGTSCTTASSWSSGRLVFAEVIGTDSGDLIKDEIIRVSPALTNGVTLTSSTFTNAKYIQYRPSGMADSSGTFKMCDDRTGAFGRTITISNTGRPSLATGVSCP